VETSKGRGFFVGCIVGGCQGFYTMHGEDNFELAKPLLTSKQC